LNLTLIKCKLKFGEMHPCLLRTQSSHYTALRFAPGEVNPRLYLQNSDTMYNTIVYKVQDTQANMNNHNLIMPDPRPTRADAVTNRELLLSTAPDLFERVGVDVVTMTPIAQEANVGKGTLYRHFNNKNDICQALLDQDMRDLQSRT